MADENGRPVTEREWKQSLDYHNRQHITDEEHRKERAETERQHRDQVADILRQIREEAKASNDERMEAHNGFQQQFNKAVGTFVTKTELDAADRAGAAAIAAIGDEVRRRLSVVENKQSNMDGKMAAFAFIAMAIPTVLAVYALVQ